MSGDLITEGVAAAVIGLAATWYYGSSEQPASTTVIQEPSEGWLSQGYSYINRVSIDPYCLTRGWIDATQQPENEESEEDTYKAAIVLGVAAVATLGSAVAFGYRRYRANQEAERAEQERTEREYNEVAAKALASHKEMVALSEQAERARIQAEKEAKEALEKARLEAEAAERARLEQEAAEKLRVQKEAEEAARRAAEAEEKARLESERAQEQARLEAEALAAVAKLLEVPATVQQDIKKLAGETDASPRTLKSMEQRMAINHHVKVFLGNLDKPEYVDVKNAFENLSTSGQAYIKLMISDCSFTDVDGVNFISHQEGGKFKGTVENYQTIFSSANCETMDIAKALDEIKRVEHDYGSKADMQQRASVTARV